MATLVSPTVESPGRLVTAEKPSRLSATDLLLDRDLSRKDLKLIFDLAEHVKASPGSYARALQGKQLALIFEKPSLRTRVTFEVGMTSMGGYAVYLDHAKPRLGERESIKDIARNLERWVHGITARTFGHESVVELAEHASIPVINALTDLAHPCQALADLFTLHEKYGNLKGLKLAFVGDGNNVCNSLMVTGAKLGVSVSVATPPGYGPSPEMVKEARACGRQTGATIELFHDPVQAVTGAQAVYTDVWTSMGQEYAAHLRTQVFAPYQVTDSLMAAADPSAVFMHCLPAHRGQEVSNGVIDSPQSIVYDQAENRLHVQKALLILLLQNGRQ
ncbi:MAG TPA: ornithine carbamoyltransferase [Terriglobia bacterium]|jgi:ornithine carbamoyltransferase|nr:ornithine carbamoyltransferase [Terriglobia bacterium]